MYRTKQLLYDICDFRDNCGDTPLHLAAENGFSQTMKVLLGLHPHLLNAANKSGVRKRKSIFNRENVEDERRVILTCPLYSAPIEIVFTILEESIQGFTNLPENQKFKNDTRL